MNRLVANLSYCLMEKGGNEQITGSYIQNRIEDSDFLVLYFSKTEAKELLVNANAVVRGIDKRHLAILCDYSDNFRLNLAIKQFLRTEAFGVDAKLIRDYFL